MKLSKLFHTLYATVMALPVLIIPIFALNILHKEVEPISIEVENKQVIDLNQYVKAESLGASNVINGVTFENNDNGTIWINGTASDRAVYFVYNQQNYVTLVTNHKYYVNFTSNVVNGLSYGIYLGTWYGLNESSIFTAMDTNSYQFWISVSAEATINNVSVTPMLIDMTKMYGEGNEPTLQEMKNYINNRYIPYTESQKMLISNGTTRYDDTDIGSQFVYALYKPVNDYFNFGEFFGLSGMYDWFQLNIFNGTAPLSFFIVFNVMIYWLFISLFWLIFDILIYVPMVIHKWLDKAEM